MPTSCQRVVPNRAPIPRWRPPGRFSTGPTPRQKSRNREFRTGGEEAMTALRARAIYGAAVDERRLGLDDAENDAFVVLAR